MIDNYNLNESFPGDTEYYSQSFSNRYMNWKRRHTIISALNKLLFRTQDKNLRILEIGCFDGSLIFKINRLFSGFDISFTGIDLSPAGISFALKRKSDEQIKNCDFLIMDAAKLSFADNSFDIIIATEVIEHFPAPELLLCEILRVLKPDGKVIITSPNGGIVFSRFIASLFWKFVIKPIFFITSGRKIITEYPQHSLNGRTEEGIGHGHVSVKSARAWKVIMRAAGFKINKLSGTGGLVFGDPFIDTHRIMFGFSIIMDTLLEKLPYSHLTSEILQFELSKNDYKIY
jgi:ubiquinone/menaquinone biosynthesis C-methylase UbiE